MKGIAFATTAATLIVAALGTVQAQAPDALELAQHLAAAGAVDLAIETVDNAQPKDPAAPYWVNWEVLRLQLLARRDRHGELLARVNAHSNAATRPAQVSLLAARSALHLGQPAESRQFLLQTFSHPTLGAADYREARLAVIDAYLTARNVDAAYRSMLRMRQDFAPLRPDEAERFVAGLIAAGRIDDAAGWLSALDRNSPWAALLRLRAGLIKPDAAIVLARGLLAKGASEPAWALLAAAGRAQNDPGIGIEVFEGQLDATPLARDGKLGERAGALWNLYVETAQASANQAQLLVGDDPGWLKYAARLQSSRPQLGRSLLGYLVLKGRSAQTRTQAGLQLIESLRAAKLGRAALHLFADRDRFALVDMDPRARMQLGAIAADARQAVTALAYWQGLSPPAEVTAQEWQVRQISVLFQAGKTAQALPMTRSLLESKPPPPPDLLRRLMAIAMEALEIGQTRPAQELFTSLLPLTTGADRAAVLRSLGKVHESNGEFRAAARAYLQGASLAPAPESDRDALQAREAAAHALAKAGLQADARAVYEWLARNAGDLAMRDRAARALGKL